MSAPAGRALVSGAAAAIGVGAHFYLVLVVATVQTLLRSGAAADAAGADDELLGPGALAIFAIVTGLLLLAVSYLARWSWPVVPEKGLLLVLLWLLVGAVVASAGLSLCARGACAGWTRHAFSGAWLLALAAAFSVDARAASLRVAALAVVVLFSLLGVCAPFNPCHWLPEASWLVFARVTLFHAVWYANRMLRIAESVLYAAYTQRLTKLSAAADVPIAAPQDMLGAWRVLGALAASLSAPAALRERLVSARSATPQQRLAAAVREAAAALPRLDADAGALVNWKFRHYPHAYMLAIDGVRAGWVLLVCAPYALAALPELAWLAYALADACAELAGVLSAPPAAAAGGEGAL